jgi:hypothetical protein
MKQSGAVFFESDSVGEFWYKLNLNATEPDEIEVETIQCILGKNAEYPMTIDNPSKHKIVLKQTSSNPQLFDIDPEKVIIPPFESAEFNIRFFPNSLETIEVGRIELYNKKVGSWVYNVRGEGLPPQEMDTLLITSSINKSSSGQVNFKNPFNEPTKIEIFFADDETWQLLLKRRKLLIPPLGQLNIPVSFLPDTMQES